MTRGLVHERQSTFLWKDFPIQDSGALSSQVENDNVYKEEELRIFVLHNVPKVFGVKQSNRKTIFNQKTIHANLICS